MITPVVATVSFHRDTVGLEVVDRGSGADDSGIMFGLEGVDGAAFLEFGQSERWTQEDDDVSKGNQGIDVLLAAWREGLASGDLDRIVELVTEEAEFWSQGQPPLRGRTAVREAFAPLLERYAMDQEFQCEELIVAEDWGFMRGLEVNRLRPRDQEGETVVRQRAFSVIHRGRDGIWRFHRGMTHHPPEGETAGETSA